MSNKISLWQLLQNHKIIIPIIQRDYAQGREGKESLRHNFLKELKEALDNNASDNSYSLTLDFVYGTKDSSGESMYPLDGQQRLTTLWLLHWYMAYKTGKLKEENVCLTLKKFSYETRVSSREFCEKLCRLPVMPEDGNLLNYIQLQTWYFSSWKQDPTIQSMLRMLCGAEKKDSVDEDVIDSIDELFRNCGNLENYWTQLTAKEPNICPISFYKTIIGTKSLPMTDDMYIKMNARGKPLTSFENFKADLLKWIEDKKIGSKSPFGYASLIDNAWTDIFWNVAKDTTHRIDESIFSWINRFLVNELALKDPNHILYKKLLGETSEKDRYDDNKYVYAGYKNYETVISSDLLDRLVSILSRFGNYLSGTEFNKISYDRWNTKFYFIPRFVYEKDSYDRVDGRDQYKVTTVTFKERVIFFGICKYFLEGEYENTSFSRWIRVLWNLVENGNFEFIPYLKLIADPGFKSHDIYQSLVDFTVPDKIINKEQLLEEIAKVKQILHPDENAELPEAPENWDYNCNEWNWEQAIIDAEDYAFFNGAIRFLYTGHSNNVDWLDFKTKFNNLKALIPENESERHTVKLLIPYLNQNDLRKIFSQRSLSNNNDNLKKLLITYSSEIHEFLMKSGKTAEKTQLHKDLITLCENKPGYWIHTEWKDGIDVLSDYLRRRDYYEYSSYYIGNTALRHGLKILKGLTGKGNIELVGEYH